MAKEVKVYQDSATVAVEDSDSFPLGEFPPLCDIPVPIDKEECTDRSFDCAEAIILVVPQGWWRGKPSTEYEERNDYGYHLEGNPSCDLSKGSYLMIPNWAG